MAAKETPNPVRIEVLQVPIPRKHAVLLTQIAVAMDVDYTKMASDLLSGAIDKCAETLDAMTAREDPPDTQ